MKLEHFNLIMNALDERINSCSSNLKNIKTTKDLGILTLSEATILANFCKEECVLMTKICMVDLYHIIGMGNLSPQQMMKFVYRMRDYLQYRPVIKRIAEKLVSIYDLPELPVKTKFKLLALCDLCLVHGEGEESSEVDDSFEDYLNSVQDQAIKLMDKTTSASLVSENSFFELSGNEIIFDKKYISNFSQLLELITKTTSCLDTLRSRINNKKAYFGVDWSKSSNNKAIGTINNPMLLNGLKICLSKM